MNIEFTEQDMVKLMESPVGDIYKECKLCEKCDNYSSVQHAGLLCDQCGGNMVSRKDWLVINLLKRLKPIPDRGENWLLPIVAYYLRNLLKEDWGKYYDWAYDNREHLRTLFRKYKELHP